MIAAARVAEGPQRRRVGRGRERDCDGDAGRARERHHDEHRAGGDGVAPQPGRRQRHAERAVEQADDEDQVQPLADDGGERGAAGTPARDEHRVAGDVHERAQRVDADERPDAIGGDERVTGDVDPEQRQRAEDEHTQQRRGAGEVRPEQQRDELVRHGERADGERQAQREQRTPARLEQSSRLTRGRQRDARQARAQRPAERGGERDDGIVRAETSEARPPRPIAATIAASWPNSSARPTIAADAAVASVSAVRRVTAMTRDAWAGVRLASRMASVASPKSASAPKGKQNARTYAYRPSSCTPSQRTSATAIRRLTAFVTTWAATSAETLRPITAALRAEPSSAASRAPRRPPRSAPSPRARGSS